ncbi:MAG: hypothetical protein EA396_01580 [Anaerolineaceae bacterium]|nr:MAG: hypothetical protein EA396_01580 [Anaerolineaceae bacterium]
MIDDITLEQILKAKRERLYRRQRQTPTPAIMALADMQSRPIPSLNTVNDAPLIFGHIHLREEAYDPVAVALRYARLGFDAVSLFTDRTVYSHGTEDVLLVSRGVPRLPVFTQNYLLDPYGVLEMRASGAGGVILHADLMPYKTLRHMVSLGHRLKMSIAIHVKDAAQMADAVRLAPHAVCVGDAVRFDSARDHDLIERLRPLVPYSVRFFAYGSVHRFDDLEALLRLKVDAVQIDEHLISTPARRERLLTVLESL